jgi:hypothetical protein
MKTLTFDKRSILVVGLVAVLVGLLITPAVLAAPPAGIDPNYPIQLSAVPDQAVVRNGELGAGEEVWYAATVTDAAGQYTDVDQVPLDLTLVITPIDGNTIRQFRMEIFPNSYAEHWSHGHIFVEGADTGEGEFHSVPFGMGSLVDSEGNPRLDTLTWNGRVNDKETVLVRIANANESAVDYALYTDDIVDAEVGQNVYTFAREPEQVEGAKSALLRRSETVDLYLNTQELIPGNVYTVWWVIFNNPDGCSAPCGEDDVFILDDEGNVLGPNEEGREAAAISVLWATGVEVGNDGVGNFQATLEEGSLPGQILFGGGLMDGKAQEAEIHNVVRDHGPADPVILDAQAYTFGGGCNNAPPGTGAPGSYTCADVQFAVHLP